MKEQTQIEAENVFISPNLAKAVRLILMAHKAKNPIQNLEEAGVRIGLEIERYNPYYFGEKRTNLFTPDPRTQQMTAEDFVHHVK